MTEIKEMIGSESARWYSDKGQPLTEVPGSTGKMVKPTLTQARKQKLFPSVTSLMNIMAKPGLENWKQEQILMSSLTLPRMSDESDFSFVKRVIADSKDFTKQTADIGKAIHKDIDLFFTENKAPELDASWEAIKRLTLMTKQNSVNGIYCEKPFTNLKYGYSGTVDFEIQGDQNYLIDFKTTDIKKYKKPYFEWGCQLAAYGQGVGFQGNYMSFVIDRKTGEFQIYNYTPEEIEYYTKCFNHILELWFLKNNYDPRG